MYDWRFAERLQALICMSTGANPGAGLQLHSFGLGHQDMEARVSLLKKACVVVEDD